MLATGMNPFINSQGYALTGMLSVTIGAVANLILDPVFIFALNYKIVGATIATVISQCLSAGFVIYFLRKRSEYKISFLGWENCVNTRSMQKHHQPWNLRFYNAPYKQHCIYML